MDYIIVTFGLGDCAEREGPDVGRRRELQPPATPEEDHRSVLEPPFIGQDVEIPFDAENDGRLLLARVLELIAEKDSLVPGDDALGHAKRARTSVAPQVPGPARHGRSILKAGLILLIAPIGVNIFFSPEGLSNMGKTGAGALGMYLI